MDDTVFRQAAIDAAIDASNDWDGDSSNGREWFIRERLEKLPSAGPVLTQDKIIIVDLIFYQRRKVEALNLDEDMKQFIDEFLKDTGKAFIDEVSQ